MLLKISVSLAGAHSLLLGFYANLPLKNYIFAVIYSSIQAIPHWKGPKIPFQKNYFGLRKPIILHQKQNIFLIIILKVYGLVHPVHLSIIKYFVIFLVLAIGNFSENLCPGVWGIYKSNLLEAVSVVPFSIFHLKICLFR